MFAGLLVGCNSSTGSLDRTTEPGSNANSEGKNGSSPGGPNAGVVGKRKGIQDCPTVPIEEVAMPAPAAPPSVPKLFQTTCASCHGAYGEGLGIIPSLRKVASFEAYLQAVRAPKGKMPLFSATEVTDALLKADWDAIQSAVPPQPSSAAQRPAWLDWTSVQVDEAYARGLAAWRKPNVRGMACAGCHAPDGIDLAVIGYNDADVLRRAARLAEPDVALGALDLLHAQRKRYDFVALCDPIKWRPFQPGGTILGDIEESARPPVTDAENTQQAVLRGAREVAFAKSLVAQPLQLAAGDIRTLDDAHRARDETIALNIRKLRIGIPFARYSEDGFHGDAHLSFNDWVVDRGRAAKAGQEAELAAAQDTYLANPTDEGFGVFYKKVHDVTEMDPIFKDAPYRGNIGQNMESAKYDSMLLGQHLFRAELLGQRWDERPVRALADTVARQVGNPWFAFGDPSGSGNSNACAAGANCLGMPPDAAAEMLPDQSVAAHLTSQWWTAGFYFDQSLVEASYRNNEHYWLVFAMNGYPMHKAFLMTRKFLMQNEVNGKGLNEVTVLGTKGPAIIGEEQWFGWGYAEPDNVNGQGELTSIHKRFTANAFRMMAHLYTEKLSNGATVSYRTRILEKIEEWRNFLVGAAPERTAEDAALLDAFKQAVAAATEVPYEGQASYKP